MRVVVSPFDDPYLNLALEEWLAERCGCDQIMMLWVNRPCVVIGVNQNPWLECNPARLRQDGVLLVRRKSGGGAVYHDAGNLNISFIEPRRFASPERNLERMREWLGSLGLKVEVDRRFRLLVKGRKISGSAFRSSARFFVHHATLLVNCDLNMMERMLGGAVQVLETVALRSEPHAVANICEYVSEVEGCRSLVTSAVRFWAAGRREDAGLYLESLESDEREEISRRVNQLRSWEWVFGRTPFARILLGQEAGKRLVAEVRGGLMESVYLEEREGRRFRIWSGSLRFDPQTVRALIDGMEADGVYRLTASSVHCVS